MKDKLIEKVASTLDDFLNGGGKGKGYNVVEKVDYDEISKGMRVEKEHVVGNKKLSEAEKLMIAFKVARDHLKESKTYYSDLEKIEKKH